MRSVSGALANPTRFLWGDVLDAYDTIKKTRIEKLAQTSYGGIFTAELTLTYRTSDKPQLKTKNGLVKANNLILNL